MIDDLAGHMTADPTTLHCVTWLRNKSICSFTQVEVSRSLAEIEHNLSVPVMKVICIHALSSPSEPCNCSLLPKSGQYLALIKYITIFWKCLKKIGCLEYFHNILVNFLDKYETTEWWNRLCVCLALRTCLD